MMDSKGETLRSKFKLTYSAIINSITMGSFSIEDLMKKSFFHNENYLKIKSKKQRNVNLKKKLEKHSTIECIKEIEDQEKSPIFDYIEKFRKLQFMNKYDSHFIEKKLNPKKNSPFPALALVKVEESEEFFTILTEGLHYPQGFTSRKGIKWFDHDVLIIR
jgi:superfamily II RNA helicase